MTKKKIAKKKQTTRTLAIPIKKTLLKPTKKNIITKKNKKQEKETIKKIISSETINQEKKPAVQAIFVRERIITESSDEARILYAKSVFGKIIEDGKVQLSLLEALYLLEKKKIEIKDGRKKLLTPEEYLMKAQKIEPNFWVRYSVFKDMRNRGYIIKTALKFGADFRVYDRGIKPGEDHARWVVFPVHEGEILTWYEFAAKNRVAHSTKKRLLMGIVDDEGDVTYYEQKWIRP